MKHVKAYESLKPDEIKTYIVWNQSRYEILKIDSDNSIPISDRIWCYDYFYYIDGEFIYNKSVNSFWLSLDSPYLLFSSDNLDECKEYILLCNNQNKYNL